MHIVRVRVPQALWEASGVVVPWDDAFFRWKGPEAFIREFVYDDEFGWEDDSEYDARSGGLFIGPVARLAQGISAIRETPRVTSAWILLDETGSACLILLRAGS